MTVVCIKMLLDQVRLCVAWTSSNHLCYKVWDARLLCNSHDSDGRTLLLHTHGKDPIAGCAPHQSPFSWQPNGRRIHRIPAMLLLSVFHIFTSISTKAGISLKVTPCMLQPELASQNRRYDILAKLHQTQHKCSICICCICQSTCS